MLATLLFCPDGSEDCRTSEAAAVIICARASGLLPAGVQMSAATSRFSAMVAETQGALDILVLMLGAERPTSQKSAAVSALYHLGATSPASRVSSAPSTETQMIGAWISWPAYHQC